MSVEIGRVDDSGRWRDLLGRVPHATPFHAPESLAVMEKHSACRVHPLVGHEGDEPVGLFPVFEGSKGPVPLVFSPPPDLKISYLGPVLTDTEELSNGEYERRHHRFLERCLDWVRSKLAPRAVHMRSHDRYADPRPFIWNGFEVIPRFTYLVDLTNDEEALFGSFSSDARKNVRTCRDADCEVLEGGVTALRRIIRRVRDRHDEQGEPYRLPESFVVDLYERLPERAIRPYVCRVDGQFADGMVVLASNETTYRWQGGVKSEGLPTTDFLDWHIMQRASERGARRYDMVGANNERLCGYKAKFSPRVSTYYHIRQGPPGMDVLADLYQRFR